MTFEPIMKKLFLIFFVTIAFGAHAQSFYSFAGLNWGDTPEKVDQTLRQRGFSGISFLLRKKCEIQTDCILEFYGPSVLSGNLFFYKGQLDRVSVNIPEGDAIGSVLTSKYGPSLPSNITSSMSEFAKAQQDLYKRWRAPNGEALSLFGNSKVDYLSKRAYEINFQNSTVDKSNF